MKKLMAVCIFSCLALVTSQVQAQPTPVVDLIADGGDEKLDVGDVTAALDPITGYLDVTFTTVDGWVMTETHVQVFFENVGTGEFVGIRLKNGNPAPGQFDFKHEDLGGVTSDDYDDEIDVRDFFDLLVPGIEYRIHVATHAAVEVADNKIARKESAWGGTNDGGTLLEPFYGKNWAIYFWSGWYVMIIP